MGGGEGPGCHGEGGGGCHGERGGGVRAAPTEVMS